MDIYHYSWGMGQGNLIALLVPSELSRQIDTETAFMAMLLVAYESNITLNKVVRATGVNVTSLIANRLKDFSQHLVGLQEAEQDLLAQDSVHQKLVYYDSHPPSVLICPAIGFIEAYRRGRILSCFLGNWKLIMKQSRRLR